MRSVVRIVCLVLCVCLFGACQDADPVPDIPVFAAMDGLDPDVRRAVEAALEKARSDPAAANLGELGRTYHANEFPELAARCYEMAAEAEPDRADWPYYIGRLAADAGDPARAADMFRTTTRLHAGYTPAYYHLGNAQLELGDLQGATAAFSIFVERIPDRAWGYLGLARTARQGGEHEKALELLLRAASLPPGIRQVSYLLAETHGILGHAEQAEAELQRFTQLPDLVAPADALMQQVAGYSTGALEFLRRAKQHEGKGELQQAEQLYRRVLQSEPQSYAALANLGNLFKFQRRYDEAEVVLLRAVEANPGQAYAHALLAGIYVDSGRLAESEAAAMIAIERDPQAFNAHFYLGRARIAAGMFTDAIEPLRRATELAPQIPDVHFALAIALAESGDRDAAIVELNDVLRLAPDHQAAQAGLAEMTGAAP